MPEDFNTKYYNLAKKEQEKHRQSEKELDENYEKVKEEERRQDALNRLHPEDSTAEPEFAKGGKVGLISRGQGKAIKFKKTKRY